MVSSPRQETEHRQKQVTTSSLSRNQRTAVNTAQKTAHKREQQWSLNTRLETFGFQSNNIDLIRMICPSAIVFITQDLFFHPVPALTSLRRLERESLPFVFLAHGGPVPVRHSASL